MKNLISMVDFVLEQYEKQDNPNKFESIVFDYANFLKQPLELWMFIPCKLVDGVWVVLEKPRECDCMGYTEDCGGCEFTNIKYQEAKERVLFDGKFDVSKKGIVSIRFNSILTILSGLKIEDLVKHNLELTPTALKQIGL